MTSTSSMHQRTCASVIYSLVGDITASITITHAFFVLIPIIVSADLSILALISVRQTRNKQLQCHQYVNPYVYVHIHIYVPTNNLHNMLLYTLHT